MDLASYWQVLKTAGQEWMKDKIPQLGAALAFYSVLSLAPLLIIAIAVAGLVFGEEAASGQLDAQIRSSSARKGAGPSRRCSPMPRSPPRGASPASSAW